MDADRIPLPPAVEKRLGALSDRFSETVYEYQVLGQVDVTTVYGLIDEALRAGAEAAAESLDPAFAPRPAPVEVRRPAPMDAATRFMLERQGVLPGIDVVSGDAAGAARNPGRDFIVIGGAAARAE